MAEDFSRLTDEDLEFIIDRSETDDDMITNFNAHQEKHLRLLGDERHNAVSAANYFGLTMNGYFDSKDPSKGYLVTDRNRTKTTFAIKSLGPFDIAESYAKKIKAYHPEWKSIINQIVGDMESPYSDFLIHHLEMLDEEC